ncbi:Scn11a [Symbiodinium natans]|uniref:Scn11a protein n=1 Tax=Symbiodinium natans TaxID=878477 RepID=A0A812U4N7_9DINO|nr:Scn11a [Symbiodinium natans]
MPANDPGSDATTAAEPAEVPLSAAVPVEPQKISAPKAGSEVSSECSLEFKRLLQLLAAQHVQDMAKLRSELATQGSDVVKDSKEPPPSLTISRSGSISSAPPPAPREPPVAREPSNRPTPRLSVMPPQRFDPNSPHSMRDRSQDGSQVSRLDRWAEFLQSATFESALSALLVANVFFMALEMQFLGMISGWEIEKYEEPTLSQDSWPTINRVITTGDFVFSAIFAVDVTVRIVVLRCRFWRTVMNWIDAIVVATSSVQWFMPSLAIDAVYLRLIRLGKLARAFRMVTMSRSMDSLQLLLKCCASSVDMLFWSFCLLTFIQCIAGMILSALVREYLNDDTKPLVIRQQVWDYYGTFTRTFLTMFEILFANWGPPCRVLVDFVDEAFSLFFLVYRCMIGFAVLNVVNAVFVQQTMLMAANDEDLAFKQKQKDWALYTKKVQRLFSAMDTSEDGMVTFDEFAQLIESPKLRFWMSQLELDYHDLLGLFEMLDDGDGEISMKEFLESARKLKGPAKAIDMHRLETKLELLLAQLLANTLSPAGPSHRSSTRSLQTLFTAAGLSRESHGFASRMAAATALGEARKQHSSLVNLSKLVQVTLPCGRWCITVCAEDREVAQKLRPENMVPGSVLHGLVK